jgi:hypothetical protein
MLRETVDSPTRLSALGSTLNEWIVIKVKEGRTR